MNQYETIIIVNPNLEAEEVEKTVNGVQEFISGNGGVINGVDSWGKRRLAYEVNRHRDGIYILIYFAADPGLIQQLARYCGLAEQIIKYMTVKAEDLPEPEAEAETATDEDEEDGADDEDKKEDKEDEKEE